MMIIMVDHDPAIFVSFDNTKENIHVKRTATDTGYIVSSSDLATNRFGNETGLTWREEAERENIRVTEDGQLYTEEA